MQISWPYLDLSCWAVTIPPCISGQNIHLKLWLGLGQQVHWGIEVATGRVDIEKVKVIPRREGVEDGAVVTSVLVCRLEIEKQWQDILFMKSLKKSKCFFLLL